MLVLKSEAHPSGYLNFFADWTKLSQLIISESYLDTFGDVDVGNNSTIVIEHTSVNPNKALHIGHIRNIIIGDTVSRILKKSKL
jgi:Arginyl-tRNA synthetase